MSQRQTSGHLYRIKGEQQNNKSQYEFLVTEIENDMSQISGPAILFTVINSSTTKVRVVHNLDKAIQIEKKIFDSQNRYFYRNINILKPCTYQNILNSKLTLLKHV